MSEDKSGSRRGSRRSSHRSSRRGSHRNSSGTSSSRTIPLTSQGRVDLSNVLTHCKQQWGIQTSNGYGDVKEAMYFSTYTNSNGERVALPVYIDVRDGLNCYFLRDGIHDKWNTKSLQQSTGIRSDGRTIIKRKVFITREERALDSSSQSAAASGSSASYFAERSSVRSIKDKYQTNHIDIWPENKSMYEKIENTGEDVEDYNSFHVIEEFDYALKTIRNEVISGNLSKRQFLNRFAYNDSAIIDMLFEAFDTLTEEDDKGETTIDVDELKSLPFIIALMQNFIVEDDDEGWINMPRGILDLENGFIKEYIDAVEGVAKSGNWINIAVQGINQLSEIYTNLVLKPYYDSLQWRKSSTGDDISPFYLNPKLGITLYGNFRSSRQIYNESGSRNARRESLNELFLSLQYVRNSSEISLRSLDHGVNSGTFGRVINNFNIGVEVCDTVGKIFDMEGSLKDYGNGNNQLPPEQWEHTGFLVAINVWGFSFFMSVRGDPTSQTKAISEISLYDPNDTTLIGYSPIGVSADKKKVHQNAISTSVLAAIPRSEANRNDIALCCAGLVKHCGDIGQMLTNIAYLQLGIKCAVLTHDTWLMFAASNCYYSPDYNIQSAIPLRMMYAPNLGLPSDFVAFVRYEFYQPRRIRHLPLLSTFRAKIVGIIESINVGPALILGRLNSAIMEIKLILSQANALSQSTQIDVYTQLVKQLENLGKTSGFERKDEFFETIINESEGLAKHQVERISTINQDALIPQLSSIVDFLDHSLGKDTGRSRSGRSSRSGKSSRSSKSRNGGFYRKKRKSRKKKNKRRKKSRKNKKKNKRKTKKYTN